MTAFAADSLHVRDTRIFYGERELMLQGVAVGDPLLAREGRPLSDYETIAKDWNANVVRISIHPGIWRDYGRKRVLDTLHENIDAALRSGLFVILAWHAIGVPDGYTQPTPKGYVDDLYDTDFKLAKDFWSAAAKEFGQDGRVMFELWNEPTWPKPEDGGTVGPKWPQLRPFWNELIALIRGQSGNLLIVTGNGWGYNLQGVRQALIDDGNVAYAWHVYGGTDGNDPAEWERNLDGLEYRRPVLVTEWGFEPDERGSAYYGDAQSYGYLFANRFLRDKHLHYTAWCWHPDWMPRMLRADWQQPTEFGSFAKEILWRAGPEQLVRP